MIRAHRRLRPVLTHLVERVWWCADRDTRSHDIAIGPGIRPEGVDANRQVVHDTNRHSRIDCGLLRLRHLLVKNPLEPAVKVHRDLVLYPKLRDFIAGLVLVLSGPFVPLRPEPLRQCAPGGELD